jgi:hypothetical protein
MFDKETLPNSDGGSEYSERSGSDRPSPPYRERINPVMGEQVTPERRVWTRPKVISAFVIVIVLLDGLFCISQNIAIQQRQYDVQGKVGAVRYSSVPN